MASIPVYLWHGQVRLHGRRSWHTHLSRSRRLHNRVLVWMQVASIPPMVSVQAAVRSAFVREVVLAVRRQQIALPSGVMQESVREVAE